MQKTLDSKWRGIFSRELSLLPRNKFVRAQLVVHNHMYPNDPSLYMQTEISWFLKKKTKWVVTNSKPEYKKSSRIKIEKEQFHPLEKRFSLKTEHTSRQSRRTLLTENLSLYP
jgi:predicted metal-dependent hydrolase